ncbi:MAG: transcription factor S [archaeon]
MFCPKCGSILIPKKSGERKVLACACGYSSKDSEAANIKETVAKQKDVNVIEQDEITTLPTTGAECPKCGNKQAYFWLVQTRAGDEPETKFLKCTECRHTWRDYD